MSFRGSLAELYFSLRDIQFRYGRSALAWTMELLAPVCVVFGLKRQAVSLMLAGSRLTDGERFTLTLSRHLELISKEVEELLPDALPMASLDRRCLVLAEPRIARGQVVRKGILLVSFTETSGRLYASADIGQLSQRFHLVLEPSWAGYADPSILCWTNYPEPVLVQSSERRDREFLSQLGANLVPVQYGAGDWVQAPASLAEKSSRTLVYDALCVANFGWWKRVHAFLGAVRVASMQRPDYRAALVLAKLAKDEHSSSRLHALIDHYRLRDVVEVFEDLRADALADLYLSSKVLVFPSWKEGSSRVLYEAMAHDLPVIVLAGNVGVNKDYITEETGFLVDDARLGALLKDLKETEWKKSPRDWFMQHLGPENTHRKLVQDLQRIFPSDGWSEDDVRIKANIPEARVRNPPEQSRLFSEWMATSISG